MLLEEARALKLLKATHIKIVCGLLQGPAKDGGESVLPLSWLWPHGDKLPGARPEQKLLEVRRSHFYKTL